MTAIPDPLTTPWVTVPEGGRLLAGLSRNASYRAAKTGDLPTVRVGGRIIVPTARLRELLGLSATEPVITVGMDGRVVAEPS